MLIKIKKFGSICFDQNVSIKPSILDINEPLWVKTYKIPSPLPEENFLTEITPQNDDIIQRIPSPHSSVCSSAFSTNQIDQFLYQQQQNQSTNTRIDNVEKKLDLLLSDEITKTNDKILNLVTQYMIQSNRKFDDYVMKSNQRIDDYLMQSNQRIHDYIFQKKSFCSSTIFIYLFFICCFIYLFIRQEFYFSQQQYTTQLLY